MVFCCAIPKWIIPSIGKAHCPSAQRAAVHCNQTVTACPIGDIQSHYPLINLTHLAAERERYSSRLTWVFSPLVNILKFTKLYIQGLIEIKKKKIFFVKDNGNYHAGSGNMVENTLQVHKVILVTQKSRLVWNKSCLPVWMFDKREQLPWG